MEEIKAKVKAFNEAVEQELYLNEEVKVSDEITEVGLNLFIRSGDYQAYVVNPINPSVWLELKRNIKDKKTLFQLSRYKEKKNVINLVAHTVHFLWKQLKEIKKKK